MNKNISIFCSFLIRKNKFILKYVFDNQKKQITKNYRKTY